MDRTKGDLIIVYWFDTQDDCSWDNIELIKKIKSPLAKHVGWFLNEDDDCIRILPAIVGMGEDSQEAGCSVIPKCSIKSIEKIREDELDV